MYVKVTFVSKYSLWCEQLPFICIGKLREISTIQQMLGTKAGSVSKKVDG